MTSETVQAAQRLLAERERFGLAKYGTTVDRKDLAAGDWLQHAIEEASDLLLYLMRLKQMMPGTPDSDLATLSSLAGIAPDLMRFEEQGDSVTDFNPYTSWIAKAKPAPAAAPEDAERAAYLGRWKDAPEWAEWLAQDSDGACFWFELKPFENGPLGWCEGDGANQCAEWELLGSVRCEPRPTPEGGQGVEG